MNYAQHSRTAKPAWLRRVSLALTGVFALGLVTEAAAQGACTTTGTVFNDINFNGLRDVGDPGVGGVAVAVYDSTGAAVGTATADASGAYTVTGNGTAPLRVEFTQIPEHLHPGTAGRLAQFVADCGATVDLPLTDADQFCEANPRFATDTFLNGDGSSGGNSIVSSTYDGVGALLVEATTQNVGAVWGLAYHRSAEQLFSAAFLKRHSALGPGGLGAIYATSGVGTGAASTALLIDLAAAGQDVGTIDQAARGLGAIGAPNHDTEAMGKVAKVGLGDLDLSSDGNTLYTVNLNTKTVVQIDIASYIASGTLPTATEVSVLSAYPATVCSNGTDRPFGLKARAGRLYLGVICDASNDAPGTGTDLDARVYAYDFVGGSWSTALPAFSLAYPRNKAVEFFADLPGNFVRWNDHMAAPDWSVFGQYTASPQPVLSDIEFDDDGSMVLGFMDRGGHQVGDLNYRDDPADLAFVRGVSAGEILRAVDSGAGYVLEDAGTTLLGGGCGVGPNILGPGGGEYYCGDSATPLAAVHYETSHGGLALKPGTGELMMSALDPINGSWTGGVVWLNNGSGQKNRGFQVYVVGNGSFGKASGIGDVELMCGPAPLEIGDRVWCDGNSNGAQDAGEASVPGVEVTLICGSDTAVTTTTDANGRYVFTDALYLAANPGKTIPRNSTCSIAIDTSAGGGNETALIGACGVATPTAPNLGGNDETDSDAVPGGPGVTIPVETGGDGENDYGFDFGFGNPPAPQDFGDVPDSYGTTLAANGANHVIVTGFHLGAEIDAEIDGQPNTAANGDDTTGILDDEDGVDFDGVASTPICTNDRRLIVTLTNTAGIAAPLFDAWIDFNGDGVFDQPAEHLFGGTSAPLTAGGNTLLYDVPCDAVVGRTYARFRLSSVGGLTPVGPADDGEVEDYAYDIKPIPVLDFGDAPDTFGTTLAANGANHSILGGFFLGVGVDSEPDGQPSVGADGDDTNGTPDDEDGVTFVGGASAEACTTGHGLTVVLDNASAVPTPLLDAWIDFDGNGVFDQPAEHLFGGTSAPLVAGSNTLSYDVPCAAVVGTHYARFRLSGAGSLPPTGPAAGGEVEDYVFTITPPAAAPKDFGDVPDSYGTTIANNGANHVIVPGFNLGPTIDPENDGQPSPGADGDGGDEDGVSFPAPPQVCSATNTLSIVLTNTIGQPALFDAWIDFDGNGTFEHPAEHLWGGTSQTLNPGSNTLTYTVPCSAIAAATYVRTRLSHAGSLPPTGPAPDGEVEDYAVTIEPAAPTPKDFGDAPDSYGTTIANNGANHVIVPGFNLGPTIDPENDGQPSPGADGDGGDEDGVSFPAPPQVCSATNTLSIVLTNTTGQPALFDAWIDFDGNGTFEHPTEHLWGGTSQTLNPGSNTLTYTVPCSAIAAATYVRTRLSHAGSLPPTGPAPDGEVEDYAVTITPSAGTPQISIAKTASSSQVEPGGTVVYTITVANIGTVDAADTQVADPLPAGLTGANWTCAASGGAVCPEASGSGGLAQTIVTFPPASQLVYTVTTMVSTNPPANIANVVTATPPDSQGVCAPGGGVPPCTASVTVTVPGGPGQPATPVPTLRTTAMLLFGLLLVMVGGRRIGRRR